MPLLIQKNDDGTTTYHGLPVTIPTTLADRLADAGEVPSEVKSMALPYTTRWVNSDGFVLPKIMTSTDVPGALNLMLAHRGPANG